MAWERRGGKIYYYAKVRRGGRVVSLYLGRGHSGQLAEAQVAEARQAAALARSSAREERGALDEIDRHLAEATGALGVAAAELLRQAGLHQHKGTWRRKR